MIKGLRIIESALLSELEDAVHEFTYVRFLDMIDVLMTFFEVAADDCRICNGKLFLHSVRRYTGGNDQREIADQLAELRNFSGRGFKPGAFAGAGHCIAALQAQTHILFHASAGQDRLG